MKKSLSVLLAFLLLFTTLSLGAIPVAAFTTTDGLIYEIVDGKVAIVGYTEGLPADLVIPDTIEGYPVTAINEEAFYGCSSLIEVTIPNSVVSIRYGAFSKCTSLISVTVGNEVSYIGTDAFYGCLSLVAISIAENNKRYSSVNGVLFDKEQSTLLLYPYAKSGEYVVPDGVTTIEYDAFNHCAALTTITIPDSVTFIDWENFRDCASLTAFSVSEDNKNYSSSNGILFTKDMTALYHYPGSRTGNYCIPQGVETICMYAFSDCSHLTSVTIPNSVTFVGVSAFSNCVSLTSVFISKNDKGFFVDGAAFADCDSLADIYYTGFEEDQANMIIENYYNNDLLNATWHYNYSLESTVIPGDANGDGKLNNRDLGLLQQYLSGWDVEIDTDACDVNGDERVNNRDLGLLQQCLAGWDVELL